MMVDGAPTSIPSSNVQVSVPAGGGLCAVVSSDMLVSSACADKHELEFDTQHCQKLEATMERRQSHIHCQAGSGEFASHHSECNAAITADATYGSDTAASTKTEKDSFVVPS